MADLTKKDSTKAQTMHLELDWAQKMADLTKKDSKKARRKHLAFDWVHW